jgi:ubiquinone/menaquinone biosynthesis C-methylase UbiE
MRRPEFIARQSRCPSGVIGRLIGRIMATETAPANEHALRLLHLMPTDHVLEVGFGHGRTIQLAADKLPHGLVAGVDLSEQMLRMASRRNRHHIAAGRVALKLSDAMPLPFPDGSFDKVYCVHVLYFWPEPRDQMREILRVLKPAGRFVVGFHARSDARAADFPRSVYRFYEADEVESLLADCGFQAITSEVSPDRTVFVSADR